MPPKATAMPSSIRAARDRRAAATRWRQELTQEEARAARISDRRCPTHGLPVVHVDARLGWRLAACPREGCNFRAWQRGEFGPLHPYNDGVPLSAAT